MEQPQAQHPPISTHWWQSTSPPEAWDLRLSDASWCHHREVQNPFPECFHSPFLAGGMNFPPPSGMLNPWPFSSDTPSYKQKKNKKTPLLSLLSLSLSSYFCSEQCLKCCMTSNSSDCLPLYSVSLIVFLNCKSLWIKASAKLLLLFAVPSCQC